MPKVPYVLTVMPGLWRTWKLDDEHRYKLVLSAFYCGYSVNYTSVLLEDPHGPEARDIIRVAAVLGLDESDKIVVRESTDDSDRRNGSATH